MRRSFSLLLAAPTIAAFGCSEPVGFSSADAGASRDGAVGLDGARTCGTCSGRTFTPCNADGTPGAPVGCEGACVAGRGCAACRGTGYRGRVGIYELLTMSDAIRDELMRGGAVATMRRLARDEGMVTLRADGWLKARAGLTTVEEVLRVAND